MKCSSSASSGGVMWAAARPGRLARRRVFTRMVKYMHRWEMLLRRASKPGVCSRRATDLAGGLATVGVASRGLQSCRGGKGGEGGLGPSRCGRGRCRSSALACVSRRAVLLVDRAAAWPAVAQHLLEQHGHQIEVLSNCSWEFVEAQFLSGLATENSSADSTQSCLSN